MCPDSPSHRKWPGRADDPHRFPSSASPDLADGAYDSRAVYEAAHERGEGRAVRGLIPPGRNAPRSPFQFTITRMG